jgi:hypothetical protein
MEQSPSWKAVKKLPPFVESESSLPYSQQPATGPYPEPDASSTHLL